MKRYGGIVAGIVTVLAILLAAGFKATPYNNFVLLADAFRHGRVWIDWPGTYIDALHYGNRYYVIEAPLPAVLLLPAVFVAGAAASQSVLAALLAGVATFAAWELGRRFAVPARTRALLCGFLLLGTDLFWCATLGDVWFIAHVAAVACTLLALLELVGARRGWLVAILAACAAESRFTMVLALPIYAAMLWLGVGAQKDERPGQARRVASFVVTLVPFVLLWIGYNEARWGVPYDIGYTAWYHQDSAGSPTGSPLRLAYLSNQLYSFFVQGVQRQAAFPYVVPGFGGQALTWTSPALLLAFFARRPRRLVLWLWLLTMVCAAPNFVYYVNGYAQFGMRHALDFEPYLIALMLLAARNGLRPIWLGLCSYSIFVGAWGVWFWRTFVRQ